MIRKIKRPSAMLPFSLAVFLFAGALHAQERLQIQDTFVPVLKETKVLPSGPSPLTDDAKAAEEIDRVRRALRNTSLSSRLDVFYNYFSGESRSFENFLALVQTPETFPSPYLTKGREAFAANEKRVSLFRTASQEEGALQHRLDMRINRRLSFEYENPFVSPHVILDPLQRRVSLALVRSFPWQMTLGAYYDPFRRESLGVISQRINRKTEFRTFLFHSEKTRENNVLASIRFYF